MNYSTIKIRHARYSRRIIKRFAILPIICKKWWNDRVDTEIRWLQTVYILQEFYDNWINERFVSEEAYLEALECTQEILREER